MTVTNTLPYIVKRISVLFLVISTTIFMQAFETPDNPPDDIKNTLRTVVIDPGHGGKDPGALGKISKEKDLALKISLKLGKLIEENVEGVKVIYTRTTDVYPELWARAQLANDNDADLFISIHVNANDNTRPSGTSTHILGRSQNNTHFETAKRENSVVLLEEDYETHYQDFDPNSDDLFQMIKVIHSTFVKQSAEFASYVQTEFKDKAKRNDRGVIQQPLLVLSQTSMPAVLIETGFITNVEEEKFLNTDYGQDLIASAIYRAFKRYKARIDGSSNFEITKIEQSGGREVEEEGEIFEKEALYFMVQVAASKNLVETTPAAFNGYEDVVVIQQGNKYKYAVGGRLSYHEALDRCTSVKEDFPGAFVIAVKNNKIIPLSDALIEINN